MTGGGAAYKHGFGRGKPSKSKQTTAGCNRRLNGTMFFILMPKNRKQPLCHCLKTVRQFQSKAAPVLPNNVLDMETGGGIPITAIQHIVNAG